MKKFWLLLLALTVFLCACGGEGVMQKQTASPEQTEKAEGIAPEAAQPQAALLIEVTGSRFYAVPADSEAAESLVEKLSSEPITVELQDYGSFEKVGALPWTLPQSDTSITTVPGDIMLYRGDQIMIFYGENTWEYTPLAHIERSAEELASAFGEGGVSVTLSVEWSE